MRLRPLRFVFVLHGVQFERNILLTVEASGLGGYLPCTLESMHVAELELVSPLAELVNPNPSPSPSPSPSPNLNQALQLVPLLRFAWHLLRQLTHRRSLAWRQEGIDCLETLPLPLSLPLPLPLTPTPTPTPTHSLPLP